jgi:hypothetical protein
MTLYILKNPIDPLAVQTITARSSAEPPSSVVALLPATEAELNIPRVTTYRITDHAPDQGRGEIDYARLVDLIFAADKVIAW